MTIRSRLTVLAATLAFAGLGVAAPLIALPGIAYARDAVSDEVAARAALTKTIAAVQAGKTNYEDMEPVLAEAAKAQEANMAGLASLGAPKSYERVGDTIEPYRYKVTFENGMALTWSITLSPSGKIAGLLVQ